MFADGSLGAETAALSEPYVQDEEEVQVKCK
jgi:predicted amidohydrolase YtcJ